MVAEGRNWGYQTVPQSRLGGREIDYSRGKGLGGSTAINFCVYTRGPSVDYDQWARLVDDNEWSWEKAQRRFNKVPTTSGQNDLGLNLTVKSSKPSIVPQKSTSLSPVFRLPHTALMGRSR